MNVGSRRRDFNIETGRDQSLHLLGMRDQPEAERALLDLVKQKLSCGYALTSSMTKNQKANAEGLQ